MDNNMELAKSEDRKLIADIERYQKKFPKYVSTKDTEKLLHCIHKLKHLPIKPEHLQITSVGKEVNKLKDHPNGVGEKAQQLLWNWKLMTRDSIIKENTKEPKKHKHKEKKSKHSSKSSPHKSSSSKKSKRHSSHHKDHKKSRDKKSSKPSAPMTDFEEALMGKAVNSSSKAPSPQKPTKSTAAPIFPPAIAPSFPEMDIKPVELSTNYKPLPLFMHEKEPSRSVEVDNDTEEGLNYMFGVKAKRTRQMYGKGKTGGCTMKSVPSLFNCAIHVLHQNIESIEATGGIPYIILKSLLEKATARQLFNLEHYNPYLLDDTDELWEIHCKRTFRHAQREDMESWRDMYVRCTDEKERKFRLITQRLEKKFVSQAPEKRRTQLANISGPTKSSKTFSSFKPSSSMASTSSVIAQRADVVGPVTPQQRATRPFSRAPATVKKAKTAPCMAKTLQLYKKLRRR